MMTLTHTPVLAEEVVSLLAAAPDGPHVDATLGAGGHAHAVVQARLARYGRAHVIGLDRDAQAIDLARSNLSDLPDDVRVDLVQTRFDELAGVLEELSVGSVASILFDLGISSMHVDQSERGFSYRHDGPLDMRMDRRQAFTAAEIVNDWPAADLRRVLTRFAEERHADRIARAIVAARPVESTAQLAAIVRGAIPAAARRTGGHPATRAFQALRIAVNDELDVLRSTLPVAIGALAPDGVLAVISYHSLEDRIVKQAFVEAATACTCPPRMPVCTCGGRADVELLTRRPIRPTEAEIERNPRASSALLRAVRRLGEEPR